MIIALLLILASDPAKDLPVYECRTTTQAVVIDGKLDEVAWDDAAWTGDFAPLVGPGGQPFEPPRTRAKLLCDTQYLYVAAELSETDVRGEMTKHDDPLYRENAFEIFIDPDGDGTNYLELEVNALATTFDLLMSRPYAERGRANSGWDVDGLRVAVHVDGTLNDPADEDRAWTVELAIPWAAIKSLAADGTMPPKPGDKWRVNMARVMTPRDKAQKARYATWSPINDRSLHVPARWGRVAFSPPAAPGGTTDKRGPATKPSAAKSR